jgi:hypothetical protein
MAAALAKLMVLTLIAVFPGNQMDTQSFVGPDDLAGCKSQALVIMNEWKSKAPDILAIMPDCHEIDDPRAILDEYLKNHPQPHKAGKDEA